MSNNKLRPLNSPDAFKDELADLALVIPGDYKPDDLVGRAKELGSATDAATQKRVKDVLAAYVASDKRKYNRKDPEMQDVVQVFDLAVLNGTNADDKKELKAAVDIIDRQLGYVATEFRTYLGLKDGVALFVPITDAEKTAFDHHLAKALPTPALEPKEDAYWEALVDRYEAIEDSVDDATAKRFNKLIKVMQKLDKQLKDHRRSYLERDHEHQALAGKTGDKVKGLIGHHLKHADTKRKKHQADAAALKVDEARHEGIKQGDKLFGDALGKATDDIRKMLGVMQARGSTVDADAINDRVGKLKAGRDTKVAELEARRDEVIKVKRGQMNKDLAAAYGLLFNYGPVQKSKTINKLYEGITGSLDIFGDFTEDVHACLVAKRDNGTCAKEWAALMTKIMAKYKDEKKGAALRLKYSGSETYNEGKARHFEAEFEPYFKLIEEWDPKDAILLPISYVSIGALLGKIVDAATLKKLQTPDASSGKFEDAVHALDSTLRASQPCTAEIRYGDGTVEVVTDGPYDVNKAHEYGVFGLKIREVKAVAQLLDDMDETMAIQLTAPNDTMDGARVQGIARTIVRGRKDANVDIVYLAADGRVLKTYENINTDNETGPQMKFILDRMNINAELLRATYKKGWFGSENIQTSPLAA